MREYGVEINFICLELKLWLRSDSVSKTSSLRHSHCQGRSQTSSYGGPLEGPVLQQGELSMVCVGLSERDLKKFGGATGGAR